MSHKTRVLLAALWIPIALLIIGWSGLNRGSSGIGTSAGVPVTTGSPTSTTTASGTTTTTGSTATTGTTDSTTGSGQFSGIVYLQRLYEVRAQTVSKKVSSSVSTLTNQHALLVKIHLPSITVSPPAELVGVDYDFSALGDTVLVERGDGGSAPIYQSAIPTTSATTTEAGITYQGVPAPNYVVVGLSSAAVLSGGDIRIALKRTLQSRQWNSSTGQWVYTNSYTRNYIVLDAAKLACGDASVDSRKAYGQPNLGGAQPGDPNAPPRPVNFNGWVYKGGLFAGNMPALTGDQSGLARLQLYVPSGGDGALRLATLSLFDLGSPSGSPGAVLGVYLPDSADPNLGVAESTVTWDTKWSSIDPRSEPSSPPYDPRDPVYYSTLTGSGNEYRNFPLNRNDALPTTMAMSKICLALTDEDVNDGPYWRYFGSTEYSGGASTFPLNDSHPRVWRLGEETVVSWVPAS